MSQPITIFWFRRDLRLHDNAALWSALKSGNPVLPIFIFDKTILDLLPKKDARVEFIHQEITAMKAALESKGSSLRLFYGTPSEVFKQLNRMRKFAIKRSLSFYKKKILPSKAQKIMSFLKKTKSLKMTKSPILYLPHTAESGKQH